MRDSVSYKNKAGYYRIAIFSLAVAVLVSVGNYFCNNLPVFTGENLKIFNFLQRVSGQTESEIDFNDVLFVNVSYDKVLIPMKDISGNTIGTQAITDRQKLSKLLEALHESGNYRYVFLDIAFEDVDMPEVDDSLFSIIEKMDRFSFVTPNNDSSDISHLKDKQAPAFYSTTSGSQSFIRYQYMSGNENLIPLKAYEELHPDKEFVRKGHGFFSIFSDSGHLCQNSLFLRFNANNDFKKLGKLDETFVNGLVCYNLGDDIVNPLFDGMYSTDEFLRMNSNLTNGKIVLIGDFQEDMHSTYLGQVPGCMIIYQAFKALERGEHIIKWGMSLLWFVVFWLVAFFALSEKAVWDHIKQLSKRIIRKCGLKKNASRPKSNKEQTSFILILKKIAYVFIDYLSIALLLQIVQYIEFASDVRVTSIAFPVYVYFIINLISKYKMASKQ